MVRGRGENIWHLIIISLDTLLLVYTHILIGHCVA
jgi:hypothetical protein